MALNWISVIIAAVVNVVIGMAWYSVLGETWMKLIGFTKKDIPTEGMPVRYVASIVSALILATVLGLVINGTGAYGAFAGMGAGALMWLGFVATMSLNTVLWEQRSVQLYAFNNACSLLSFIVMGFILGVFV